MHPVFEQLPARVQKIVQEEVDVSVLRFGIKAPTVADVFSDSHKRSWCRTRWAIWWRLRMELTAQGTQLSYPKIGNMFGCDHTTIMYGVRHHPKHLVEWAAAKQRLYSAQRLAQNARAHAQNPDIVLYA